MKIIFRILFVAYLFAGCNSINKLYVDFGAEKDGHPTDSEITRIYFDRNGFIYPNHINDQILKHCYSRLGCYYFTNPNLYAAACAQNNAAPYAGDMACITPSVDPLQQKLIDNYSTALNSVPVGTQIVFIIHGFNEHPSLPTNHTSSFCENSTTEANIKSHFPGGQFHFVEIYWDGMSAENGSKILTAFNSLHVWPHSQVSATYAGLELRRLLAALTTHHIVVITHSHGAGVITTALFNVKKFNTELYDDPESWLYSVNNKFKDPMYKTPLIDISIGMLAPAIPGTNVFKYYYNRTIGTANTTVTTANYHFIVGFNRYDQITSKYQVASKKFGATTLACDREELAETKSIFHNNSAIVDDIDFSREADHSKQKKHSWFKYMLNQPSFNSFLDKTFH